MEPNLVGRNIGNYVVLKKLGSGGMGTVYLCEHPLLKRKAALKILHEDMAEKPDVVDRFFHEAKAAAEIGHPNIVDVLDFGRVPGDDGKDIVYLLMEFLEGESLSARHERQPLSIPEIQHIFSQCCAALTVSHQKGIIHRDLKPENIYVILKGDDPLFVKVLDFGIAKLVSDPTQLYHTSTGIILGTPWYMSPEQCAGTGHIDARADIYSLGVVLYELLTGRVPFPDKGWGDVIIAHLTKEPPAPRTLRPELPREWEALVLHALEKDPTVRIPSMEAFATYIADPLAHAAHYHHRVLPPRPVHHDAVLQQEALASTVQASSEQLHAAQSSPGVHAQPTMLGGAGEMQPHIPTGSMFAPTGGSGRGAMTLAIVGVVLGALSLIGMGVVSVQVARLTAASHVAPTPTPTPTLPPVSPTSGPIPPEMLQVRILSEPPGATVVRLDNGEKNLGTTPMFLSIERGSPPIAVQLRLDGYRTLTRVVTSERSTEITLALAKGTTP